MKIINTGIVEKNGQYFIIEEIKNTRKVSKLLKEKYPQIHKYYRIEPYVYRNANNNEFIDIIKFQGCKFVNIRTITSPEFYESKFFQNYKEKIVDIISHIAYKKGPKYYKYTTTTFMSDILETKEFLTSEFAKKHYKEIFNTLDNIVEEKEKRKKVEDTNKQVLSLKIKNK